MILFSVVTDQTTSYDTIQDNVHYNKLLQCRETNRSEWHITKVQTNGPDRIFSGMNVFNIVICKLIYIFDSNLFLYTRIL